MLVFFKKGAAIFIATVMCLSSLPLSALAEEVQIFEDEQSTTLVEEITNTESGGDFAEVTEPIDIQDTVTVESIDDASDGEVIDFGEISTSQMSTAALDAELLERITDLTAENVSGDAWKTYLQEVFTDITGIRKVGSTITGTINWNTTDTASLPHWDGTIITDLSSYTETTSGTTNTYTDSVSGDTVLIVDYPSGTINNATTIYYVYTAETLYYVMHSIFTQSKWLGSISLERDIDLNGYEWGYTRLCDGQSIYGNNHTIYNLRVTTTESGNYRYGFVSTSDIKTSGGPGIFKDLKFDTAYIVGAEHTGKNVYSGIFAFPSGGFTMDNIHVNNIVSVGTDQVSGFISRFQGASPHRIIKKCSVTNSTIYGTNDHTAAFSSTMFNAEVSNCFATECSVISLGTHSGGFISCANTIDVKNCFADVMMYGSSQTGSFIGNVNADGAPNGPSSFANCYASGFVEGQDKLGGFIGDINSITPSVTFENCYSTALVGLRSSGTNEGGFMGGGSSGNNNATFKNCYAAGEVGSIDTDDSSSGISIGGFIGSTLKGSGTFTFTNCYYDKQTTAMRERGIGQAVTPEKDNGSPDGVLTTDTTKSGLGLMSTNPTSTSTGFKGFSDTAAWDYSAAKHYPELTAFKNAVGADWGGDEYANIVKAYSQSSTSGVLLDTWDKGLDTSTGELTTAMPETTYCTVRDMTSGFQLTSTNGNTWNRIGTADSKGTTGAKTEIKGKSYDVFNLRYANGQWLADELIPGIDWLKVSYTDPATGAVATRRVRVVPTASIDAGKSFVVTDKYDHADDVSLFFSTGPRLNTPTDYVTTGILPDRDGSAVAGANEFTEEQLKLMGTETASGTTPATATTVNGTAVSSNDLFADIDVSEYMSTETDDNAKGSKVYIYVYKATGFDADGEIKTEGSAMTLSEALKRQLNGYETFTPGSYRYLISYMWQLDDGRVLQDAKLIRRADNPFTANLNVYKDTLDDANLYTNGAEVYTDTFTGTFNAATAPLTAGAQVSKVDYFQYKDKAATAWKLTNSGDTLDSVKISVIISGSEIYSQTITNPTVGDTIPINCTWYRIVYRNGGYFSIPEHAYRTYTLKKSGDIWYLEFDKDNEIVATDVDGKPIDELIYNDLETNIRVDVVAKTPEAGNLKISKVLIGSDTDANADFNFTVTLPSSINAKYNYIGEGGAANGTVQFTNGIGTVTLKGGQSATITGIPSGSSYKVVENEANANGYTTTKAGDVGTIAKDVTSTCIFINSKNLKPGTLVISKIISGNGANAVDEFNFDIALVNSKTAIDGTYSYIGNGGKADGTITVVGGKASTSLKGGESISISGIPETTTYTVTEAEANQGGYTTTQVGDTGSISKDNISVAVFTNTKKLDPDTLTITKLIAGNAANPNDVFNFNITLANSKETIDGTYSYVGSGGKADGSIIVADGKAGIALKGGESVTISGIPATTTYAVSEVEANQNGYVTTQVNETGVTSKDNANAVIFTNTKNETPQPPVGNFTVEKTADKTNVKLGEEITYTLALKNTTQTAVNNVRVRDYIPAGTKYIDGSATNGGVYGVVDLKPHVTWNVASVEAGQTINLSFKVTVTASNTTIINTASYDVDDTTPPTDAKNPSTPTNTATVDYTPGETTIAQTGDNSQPVLWIIMAVLSACCIIICIIIIKRRKDK